MAVKIVPLKINTKLSFSESSISDYVKICLSDPLMFISIVS